MIHEISVRLELNEISLSHGNFTNKLSAISSEATFDDFSSREAEMIWLLHLKPNICCAVSFQPEFIGSLSVWKKWKNGAMKSRFYNDKVVKS